LGSSGKATHGPDIPHREHPAFMYVYPFLQRLLPRETHQPTEHAGLIEDNPRLHA
jgi:hypothetical protein